MILAVEEDTHIYVSMLLLGRELFTLALVETSAEFFARPEGVVVGHVDCVTRSRHSAAQRLAQSPGVVTVVATAKTDKLNAEFLAAFAELGDV